MRRSRTLGFHLTAAGVAGPFLVLTSGCLSTRTPLDARDLAAIAALVLGLPTTAFVTYKLLRFWRSSLRRDRAESADIERELAYLLAFQGYIEELDRPLGYQEDEYTSLGGTLLQADAVALRFIFRKSAALDQLGLSAGDIVPISDRRYIEDVTKFLSRSRDPVVLLGEPGSGKSVTLRHVALDVSRHEAVRQATWPLIPLYVQLGAYSQVDGNGQPVSVLDFLKYQLENVIPGGKSILPSLESLLTQRRMLILLDSMDEMPNADFVARSQRLKEFLTEFGRSNHVVLACRKREYSGVLPHSELLIEPFNPGRIRTYLQRHWDLYSRLLTPEQRHATHADYLSVANPGDTRFDFTANPFFLKLLVTYFFRHQGRFPTTKAELLEAYVTGKLAREIERGTIAAQDRDAVLHAWSALAYGMLETNTGTYVSLDAAIDLACQRTAQSPVWIRKTVLAAITGRLMRQEADGSVRFEHHRFLEYLAARYWQTQSQHDSVQPRHLSNPWWRETLVLRAGLTSAPDALMSQLMLALRAWEQATSAPSASGHLEIRRLEYIAAFDVVLLCARQSWSALSPSSRSAIMTAARRIARDGSVIQQIRLLRGLQGIGIQHTVEILQILASTKSDWLLSELFRVLNESDYATEELGRILQAFADSTAPFDLFERWKAVGSRRIWRCLTGAHPAARRVLLRALVKGGSVWAVWLLIMMVLYLVVWFSDIWNPQNLDPRFRSQQALWRPAATLLLPTLVFLFFAGWRFTGISIACYILLSLAVPPQTAFRLYGCIGLALVIIRDDYRRAQWIHNRLVRAWVVYWLQPSGWRAFNLTLFFSAAIILANHYLTAGPTSRTYHAGGGLLLTLGTEVLWYWRWSRQLRHLFIAADTAVERHRLTETVLAYIAELRRPWPRRAAKRILDRIVNLRSEDPIVLHALAEVAERGEHFVRDDDLQEAIDRIDLRRRQQLLE